MDEELMFTSAAGVSRSTRLKPRVVRGVRGARVARESAAAVDADDDEDDDAGDPALDDRRGVEVVAWRGARACERVLMVAGDDDA